MTKKQRKHPLANSFRRGHASLATNADSLTKAEIKQPQKQRRKRIERIEIETKTFELNPIPIQQIHLHNENVKTLQIHHKK